MRVLVTGGSGFVGSTVITRLRDDGHDVVAPMRRPIAIDGIRVPLLGELDGGTDWSAVLDGCQAVVHCAARAHILQDRSTDPLEVYRRINRDATLRLASQAAAHGIGHFVFISTVKVNGENSVADRPFRSDDIPAPEDAYGISKAEAEDGLRCLGDVMTMTILRPPLVHGPNVKGNLATLLKVIRKGIPLPLRLVRNRRSVIGVDNLADSIAFVLDRHVSGTYMLRDGAPDPSTAELIRLIAEACGRSARLLPIPPSLLNLGATMLGRRGMAERVLGTLVVDDAPLRGLGWTPPLSLRQGLLRMIEGSK